jgi:predicted DNA-binding ribbon-helix-helix protein
MEPSDKNPKTSTAPGAMKKRSVVIAGHRTSVSLENVFWVELKKIAASKGQTVNQLVTDIDRDRDGNLSSAIRVYVLLFAQALNPPQPNDRDIPDLPSSPLQ